MAEIVLGVDYEIRGIDIVGLDDPFEEFRLMHDSLFHEINDLVLHSHKVLHPIIQLHL